MTEAWPERWPCAPALRLGVLKQEIEAFVVGVFLVEGQLNRQQTPAAGLLGVVTWINTVHTLEAEGSTLELVELGLKVGVIFANVVGVAAGGIGLIVDGICSAIGGNACQS